MDMAYYLIARIRITDRETYERYAEGFMEIFARYQGKMLAVDEKTLVLEGAWSLEREQQVTRTVLIEFPTKRDALDWYESDEYQALAQYRFAASAGDVVMIEGLPAKEH
ncbi:MAG: hypothetical protein ACI8Z1_000630 [Candidatus Azotimanducaceae bacterium]|jgi:uncharacterized protein (DUF1330 family)